MPRPSADRARGARRLGLAETLVVAIAVASLASILTFAEQHASWRTALATSLGWLAIAFAVNRALAIEKRRLAAALGELARLKHGIEQLDAGERQRQPAAVACQRDDL